MTFEEYAEGMPTGERIRLRHAWGAATSAERERYAALVEAARALLRYSRGASSPRLCNTRTKDQEALRAALAVIDGGRE